MAVYAIGDVHACLPELKSLLAELNFCPENDRLWFVGDLISRGPESLETLRFVHELGNRAIVVMGNHEGRAVAGLSQWHDQALGPFLQELKSAPDATELERWLRHIPLFHYDQTLGIAMVHAGISPVWSMEDVHRLSTELSRILQDPQTSQTFFQNRNGFTAAKEPSEKEGMVYLRFAFSVMTRIRMCTWEGHLLWPNNPLLANVPNPHAFIFSEGMPPSFHPWFELRPKEEKTKIIYGHWASAGLNLQTNTWGLDSGCVYGGKLTAMRLDHPEHPIIQVPCRQYINHEDS